MLQIADEIPGGTISRGSGLDSVNQTVFTGCRQSSAYGVSYTVTDWV